LHEFPQTECLLVEFVGELMLEEVLTPFTLIDIRISFAGHPQ